MGWDGIGERKGEVSCLWRKYEYVLNVHGHRDEDGTRQAGGRDIHPCCYPVGEVTWMYE